jgi:predicted XRE-type DNA-binding protein
MVRKTITDNKEIIDGNGTRSTGNVFADLGIRDPNLARLKADVAIAIKSAIERKGITQREAGDLIGLPSQKVSDIVCGRLKGYTLDRLFTYLNCLDVDVRIKMTVKPVKRQHAELRAI